MPARGCLPAYPRPSANAVTGAADYSGRSEPEGSAGRRQQKQRSRDVAGRVTLGALSALPSTAGVQKQGCGVERPRLLAGRGLSQLRAWSTSTCGHAVRHASSACCACSARRASSAVEVIVLVSRARRCKGAGCRRGRRAICRGRRRAALGQEGWEGGEVRCGK